MKSISKRNISLDLLRIFCCFCIIALHETGNIIEYQGRWVLFQAFVRPALFAFAALSGYFVISSCDTKKVKDFYIKRLATLIIPLFVYSVLIRMAGNKMDGFRFIQGINKGFFLDIVSGIYSGHLWFIYSMIGLYLITPYLKMLLDILDNKQIIKFLAFIFIFTGILPILKYYGYNVGVNIIFNDCMLFYYILGYLLSKITFTKKNIKVISIIGIVNILVIILFLYKKPFIQSTLWTTSIHMIIGIVFYFALASLIENKIPKVLEKPISYISARTYSLYIVHFFVLQRVGMANWFKYTRANVIPVVIIKCIIIFAISLGTAIIVDYCVVNPIKKITFKLLLNKKGN